MINVPSCYYSKPLLKLIDSHIDFGYKSYTALTEDDQELIAAQCLEILGDDAYDSIDFSSISGDFIKYLRTSKSEHAYDTLREMAKITTAHFTDVMDALFDERVSEQYAENMREHGFTTRTDSINGEISWRKSA